MREDDFNPQKAKIIYKQKDNIDLTDEDRHYSKTPPRTNFRTDENTVTKITEYQDWVNLKENCNVNIEKSLADEVRSGFQRENVSADNIQGLSKSRTEKANIGFHNLQTTQE